MHCLKCGRETVEDQVFCDQCLAGMEKAPVKPGTSVNLPPVYARLKKQSTEKTEKPEAIISRLEKRIHRLTSIILVLVVLFLITAGALAWVIFRDDSPIIGQNYSTMTDPDETGN